MIVMAGVAPPAAAFSAEELFEDGNRLFRNELYWAALLRYRQAADAGLATPLLHYNTGVAHYHARQYDRARDALMLALESPMLLTAAQYNLGLTELGAGNYAEALRWMRVVEESQEGEILGEYAREAISRISRRQAQREPLVTVAATPMDAPGGFGRQEKKYTHFQLLAQVGFGTDDNVYRTPDGNYIDFSDPALPIVAPEPVSGAYIPVDILAKYRVDPYTNEGFFGAYRLQGVAYQEQEFNDADEYAHEIAVGSEFHSLDEVADREREVYSAFTIAQHEETYFDPSTGTYFEVVDENGELVNIPGRMDYLRYGPELNLRQRLGGFTLGLGAKAQLWNYADTEIVPEYDHRYFVLNALMEYQFSATSLVRLTAAGSSRRFGDRPAFDLAGQQLPGNPNLRYDYIDFGLAARQRITPGLWFSMEYARVDRSDQFEGYNDYSRNLYGTSLHWRVGDRFRLAVEGWYSLYAYDNAFAFNDPLLPRKTLEMLDIDLFVSYRITPGLSLVLEANRVEKVSNDMRLAFDRNRYSLAIRWTQ